MKQAVIKNIKFVDNDNEYQKVIYIIGDTRCAYLKYITWCKLLRPYSLQSYLHLQGLLLASSAPDPKNPTWEHPGLLHDY